MPRTARNSIGTPTTSRLAPPATPGTVGRSMRDATGLRRRSRAGEFRCHRGRENSAATSLGRNCPDTPLLATASSSRHTRSGGVRCLTEHRPWQEERPQPLAATRAASQTPDNGTEIVDVAASCGRRTKPFALDSFQHSRQGVQVHRRPLRQLPGEGARSVRRRHEQAEVACRAFEFGPRRDR